MALDVFFTPSAKLDLREARDHYRKMGALNHLGVTRCDKIART